MGKDKHHQIPTLAPGSVERQFVKNVLRQFVKGRSYPEIPTSIEWEKLNPWLFAYNLAPIFYAGYTASAVSSDVYSNWQMFSMKIWHNHEIYSKATVDLFSILNDNGIDAVVLRGLSISSWLYSDPTLRPMRDVDLLIREKDRYVIVEILKQHGVHPKHLLRSQIVYEIDGTIFEIHWSFFTPKRYQGRIDFNDWFSVSNRLDLENGFFHILSPEHQCLDLINHGFVHHEFDKPMQLVDVALMITQKNLDWDLIRAECEKTSMSRITAFSLWYVNRFLHLGMENKFQEIFGPAYNGSEKLYQAYQDLFFGPDPLSGYLRRKKHLLQVTEGVITKFKQGVCFLTVKEFSTLRMGLANGGYFYKGNKN